MRKSCERLSAADCADNSFSLRAGFQRLLIPLQKSTGSVGAFIAVYSILFSYCRRQMSGTHRILYGKSIIRDIPAIRSRYDAKNTGTRKEARSIITAPPSLDEICANGISSILFAAISTATSPVPPIFAIHRPAVMAASMG